MIALFVLVGGDVYKTWRALWSMVLHVYNFDDFFFVSVSSMHDAWISTFIRRNVVRHAVDVSIVSVLQELR